MSGVPEGWTLARVGDVVTLNPKNRCDDDLEVGFIPLQLMGTRYRDVPTFERRKWVEVKRGYSHFADGDVCVARITPSFENGKAGIVRNLPNGVGAGSTEYFVCRPHPEVLISEYLLAFFKMAEFLRNGEQVMSGAVGQQRVPKQYILDLEIPLPPLSEQRRIADKLDVLLGRVDACRARLERVPALLKRFRQAVLAAAVEGRLTEEWREENACDSGWVEKQLNELGLLARGKSKHRPRNDPRLYGGPYPFVQTGDIAQSRGVIDAHNQTYSEFGLKQSKLWPPGTVAITIAANIANTAILNYPACFPDSVVGFVADCDLATPEFIKWSIDVLKDDLEDMAPATAQKNINLEVLSKIKLRCPTLAEQKAIVERVNTLLSYADNIEARYSSADAQLEQLGPGLLARAFRGELGGGDRQRMCVRTTNTTDHG